MKLSEIHRHDQVWAGYKWNNLTGFDAPKLQWDEATVEAVNVHIKEGYHRSRTYGPVAKGEILEPGGGVVILVGGNENRRYITPSRYIQSLDEHRTAQALLQEQEAQREQAYQDNLALGREWLIEEMALEIEPDDPDTGAVAARRVLDLLTSDDWGLILPSDLAKLGRLRRRLLNNDDKTEETA